MFVINISYKVDLKKVDAFLAQHVEFLNQQYESGIFIASGRKVPRTGGVILAQADSRSELEEIIAQDPFKQHELAVYELIEFIPSKTSAELNFLKQE